MEGKWKATKNTIHITLNLEEIAKHFYLSSTTNTCVFHGITTTKAFVPNKSLSHTEPTLVCMIAAADAIALSTTTRLSCRNINSKHATLTNISKYPLQILQQAKNYKNKTAVMNLRFASFAALAATSSAWSPASSISMTRPIHQNTQHRHRRSPIHPYANTMTTTTTALGSALAAPSSSSSSDATSGRPIAMGSIVNIFRGGLVAVKIDDDLSAVNISLEVNIPEVMDPSESVPDELKSKKSKDDDLGMSRLNHAGGIFLPRKNRRQKCSLNSTRSQNFVFYLTPHKNQ